MATTHQYDLHGGERAGQSGLQPYLPVFGGMSIDAAGGILRQDLDGPHRSFAISGDLPVCLSVAALNGCFTKGGHPRSVL